MADSYSDEALATWFASIDGPSAVPEEATYKCSKVPVHYALELPIPVAARGSTVRYAFSTEAADISFGIYIRKSDEESRAQNGNGGDGNDGEGPDEGEESELLATERVDSHLEPITGSFIVPNAPCVVLLCWENHYSWFKSKTLSYSVTVKPPSVSQTLAGKKQRVSIAMDNVSVDKNSAEVRLMKVLKHRQDATERLKALKDELRATELSLVNSVAEEKAVRDRLEFRGRQEQGLQERLAAIERGNDTRGEA